MGSQRVWHDLVTKQQQNSRIKAQIQDCLTLDYVHYSGCDFLQRFWFKILKLTLALISHWEISQKHVSMIIELLQEGGPLPGPKTGLLSNTRKWIVWGDTCADKARDFIGKGHPGGEQEGKETQENCSVTWLAMLGFTVMGLVSGWSLANHSNSESFLGAHASLSQDGC